MAEYGDIVWRRGTEMSDIGAMNTTYTATGLERYQVGVAHRQLHKFQVVKGDDPSVVQARARALAGQWDEAWRKRAALEKKQQDREAAARSVGEKKQIAAQRTEEAKQVIKSMSAILLHTLDIDDTIDWETLKDTSAYSVPEPVAPTPPSAPKKPAPPHEPQPADFQPKLGILDKLVSSRRQARTSEAAAALTEAHEEWTRAAAKLEQQHKSDLEEHAAAVHEHEEAHTAAVSRWQEEAAAFAKEQSESNLAVDRRRERYVQADPEAIADYCSMVLENSSYPECFPKSFELEYNPANRIVIVDYQLPAPTDMPGVIEVKYVASSDTFSEKLMAQRQRDQLYDDVLYQVALRTLHELFEADAVSALEAVVFNGWVHAVDPSTGQETDSCVVSVQASREEFLALGLRSVDPHACFKKLKGVGASRLYSITPVAPLLTMSREDRRFVPSRAVVDSLAEGDNLAAMDWEDFEYLIRELFEQEFAATGGEVKVTQASRDGGVDAVIFDPDPLHGGKTVVQAKRYTNTVGVAAVRDLYGTMLNEGANKGILVTTSDYGPDAYAFAKGKPLVLLTGGNLLHLLESHGHKARIDLREAKLLLGETTSS